MPYSGGFSLGFSAGYDFYSGVLIISPLDISLIYKFYIDDFNKRQEFIVWNK